MPRKAAKRARTSKPVERDWRNTLFVWRGVLGVGGSPDTGPQIWWRGAWLGSDDDAMPPYGALEMSANTFELKTEPFDHEQIYEKSKASLAKASAEAAAAGKDFLARELVAGDPADASDIFEGIEMILGGMDEEDPEGRKAFFQLSALFEMQFGGTYKLDNGDGLEDTSDDTHRWEVRAWPSTPPGEVDRATHAAVAAVGTTPFGRFVSLGVIEGSTMTLARRYIEDDDPRAAWSSPAAVLDAVLGDGPLALDEIPAKLPWKVDA